MHIVYILIGSFKYSSACALGLWMFFCCWCVGSVDILLLVRWILRGKVLMLHLSRVCSYGDLRWVSVGQEIQNPKGWPGAKLVGLSEREKG